MLKHTILFIAAALLSTAGTGCKKSDAEKRKAAVAEEKVRLTREAIKAYEALARDFPDSPHAKDAQARAASLKAKQAAGAKK